jgi:hypothetical protein
MNGRPAWLPSLLCLPDCEGDWERYLDVVYQAFRRDFVDTSPELAGRRCGLRHPELIDGREGTFWHIISEGLVEEERLPDLRRCERVRWPRPMIESVGMERIRCWRYRRNGDRRISIALADFAYLVVLVDRSSYVLLLTAFPVEKERRREKLRKEYEDSHKC